MTHFSRTCTARKRHRCHNCKGTIEPGEIYTRFSATPDDEYWTTDTWTNLKAHHPWGVCDTRP